MDQVFSIAVFFVRLAHPMVHIVSSGPMPLMFRVEDLRSLVDWMAARQLPGSTSLSDELLLLEELSSFESSILSTICYCQSLTNKDDKAKQATLQDLAKQRILHDHAKQNNTPDHQSQEREGYEAQGIRN